MRRTKWLVAAAFAILLPAAYAVADFAGTAGVGLTFFDFACFTTKHCTAQVPINSAGTEIMTVAAPAQVAGTVTAAQATAANLNATVVGTGTFVTQSTLAAETTKVIGTVNLPATPTTNLANIDSQTSRLVTGATRIIPGSALATTSWVLGARYNSTQATFTDGQEGSVQISSRGEVKTNLMDAAGNARGANVNSSNQLSVSCDNGCSGSGATFGAAFPATGSAVGMTQGGNLVALSGTSGNLNVQCANCSGSGVSTVDAAAFTASSSLFAGTGGFFQTTATSNALTNGQQGMWQMTANRAGFVNLRNAAGAEVGVTGAELFVGGRGTAGAAAGGVVTVQGVASMTKLLVTPDSVALPANQSVNVSQINGVFPLMGNGTTGTGSQRVTIASDNTAFAVNATLSAETTKVIGTVRSLGNAGAITDFAGQNAASPANSWLIGGQFNTTPTTLTTGNASPLQLDNAGKLLVNCTGCSASTAITTWAGGTLGAMANYGTSPGAVLVPGVNAFVTNTVAANVSQINGVTPLMGNGATGTGSQRVTIASDNTAFAVNATLSAETTKVIGTVNLAATPTANLASIAANTAAAVPTNQSGAVSALVSCDTHVFKHITSATDTLAVQGVTAKTIYICGWRSRAAGVATWYLANTASTNANCSSTLTQITGIATEAANTGEVMNPAFWSGLKNTSANGLCITSTGTGGVDVDIWYTQF